MNPEEVLHQLETEKEHLISAFRKNPDSTTRRLARLVGQRNADAQQNAIRQVLGVDNQAGDLVEVSEDGRKGAVYLRHVFKSGKPSTAMLDSLLKRIMLPREPDLDYPFYLRMNEEGMFHLISKNHIGNLKRIVKELAWKEMTLDNVFNQKLRYLSEEHAKASLTLAEHLNYLDGRKQAIIDYLGTPISRVAEEKRTDIRFGKRPFYSLWSGDSPVILATDDRAFMLMAETRKQPYRLSQVDDIFPLIKRQSLESIGVEFDGLLTCQGRRINDEDAHDLVGRISEGKVIYPGSFYDSSNIIRDVSSLYIDFLVSLCPDRIREGKVKAKGNPTISFSYGGKMGIVVDEPVGDSAATYVMTRSLHDSAEEFNRTGLRRARPEGLLGIVVHTDYLHWQTNIEKILRPSHYK
jgi:hypothetical protein